jgi:hypothetical protein
MVATICHRHLRPRLTDQAGARPMYASLSTWQLDESIQGEPAYAEFVGSVLLRELPTARDIGLLDALVIRTGADRIVAVTLYETEDAAEAGWSQAFGPMRELYASKISFIERVAGPADDMPQITGWWT